jgi:predicted DsbA family dithiol-disulfide isomerase
VVDRLSREYGNRIELVWHAFELRPEPVPLPAAVDPSRRRRWDASVAPMARDRGLVMNQPAIATRTRLTFQAVEAAREHGRFDAMHHALFEAYFRDGRDIGAAVVLADIAKSIGLEPVVVARALGEGTYLTRVLDQERLARDLGVTGVPAAFVGDDLMTAEPVIGAVPYEWLQAAVERASSGASLEWRRRALRSGIPLRESEPNDDPDRQ